MIAFLKSLFGLLDAFARYLADRQLLGAGEAQQRDADRKELQDRVEKAEAAVSIPDADRTDRLRNRFDRSRDGE